MEGSEGLRGRRGGASGGSRPLGRGGGAALTTTRPLRRAAFGFADLLRLPRLAREAFSDRVLILAYHGIAERPDAALPWTMIDVGAFERQVAYLARHYRVLPLRQIVEALREGRPLPPRSAAITFDDGYRNNLTLALPVLRRHRAPATVFPAAAHIGSARLLHFDRLYLALVGARGAGVPFAGELGLEELRLGSESDRLQGYAVAVTRFKRLAPGVREALLERMERALPGDGAWRRAMAEQLRILSPDEVRALTRERLVDVGAHTMTHEILANLDGDSAGREVRRSREVLEGLVGEPVVLFAYPNGQRADFSAEHQALLRREGFVGAVTTVPELNGADAGVYELGRICVGPELAADLHHFAMTTSGASAAVRRILRRPRVQH